MTRMTSYPIEVKSTPAQRERNIQRCLRILRGICGARISPTEIGYRENWSTRAVTSYLRVLERHGYAECLGQERNRESRWRITPSGRDYLHSVTAGSIGTSLDLHPANPGKGPQCQPISK